MQDSAMDRFTYAGKFIPKGKHIDVLAHLRIGHPFRLDFFHDCTAQNNRFLIFFQVFFHNLQINQMRFKQHVVMLIHHGSIGKDGSASFLQAIGLMDVAEKMYPGTDCSHTR